MLPGSPSSDTENKIKLLLYFQILQLMSIPRSVQQQNNSMKMNYSIHATFDIYNWRVFYIRIQYDIFSLYWFNKLYKRNIGISFSAPKFANIEVLSNAHFETDNQLIE